MERRFTGKLATDGKKILEGDIVEAEEVDKLEDKIYALENEA